MYRHREPDLLFARMALLERLATPAQIQRAMGLLRRIAEAGGTPPSIGELLVGEKILTDEQRQGLAARLDEANRAISEAQSGLHEVPRRIGRYELLERIGRGGMGAVYRARQLNMDRVVALKVLAPHLTRDSKYIKQFIREARAAGQVDHANIVAVHEVGGADGHFFICMEFVEGRTLSRELLARTRIPPLEALDYAAQVADALTAIEKASIVHRDIKPDNLIRTPKGRIKVTDLGLAKRLSDVTSAGQTGWACGTPYYMAPEQARDSRKVDTRTDIYSLGATLYHLVTGKLPFDGDSSVEVLMHAATDRLVPPAILCPDVPQPLSDLVERMMAREADARPRTAAVLVAEIAACRGEIESAKSGRSASGRLPPVPRIAPAGATGPGSSGLVLTVAWSAAALAVAGLVVELVVPPRKPAARPEPVAAGHPDGSGGAALPPLPEVANSEAIARDAELRGLFDRMSAALADPSASGWEGLLAECGEKARTSGRWGPLLERTRADLSARVEFLAMDELGRRRWLASEAAIWFRPAEALGQLDGVAQLWPGTAAAAAARKERANLVGLAGKRQAEAEARVADWLAAERFDRVEELTTVLGPGASGPAGAWRADLAARLAAGRKASGERVAALQQERAALAEKLAAIERLMADWDFSAAQAQAAKTALLLPRDSRPRRRLELIGKRAEALGRFRERLCERLQSIVPRLVDTRFADRPLGLTVTSADERGLELASGDPDERVSTRKPWTALGAGERWKLAVAVARQRSEEDLVGLALLAMGSGQHAVAAKYLDAADEFGGHTAVHREELAMLVSGGGEEEAERLELAARGKLAEGRPAEALTDLGPLLARLRATAWVAARRTVLERLVESAERDCQAMGLFSGRARESLPGCFALDYDFDKSRSALDWRQSGGAEPEPARLTWLREFTGEFEARFKLAGDAEGAGLVLAPRPDGSGASFRLGREGLGSKPGAEPDPDPDPEGPLEDGLALALRGGELRWRTPNGSGRLRLPPETLDALVSGRISGWHLALEAPAGRARALSARIECRLAAGQAGLLVESRGKLAAEQYNHAMLLGGMQRADDLRRFVLQYRDVGTLAATAELDRARALLGAGRSAEARQAAEEFLVCYPSQSALFPDARRLVEQIIGQPK